MLLNCVSESIVTRRAAPLSPAVILILKIQSSESNLLTVQHGDLAGSVALRHVLPPSLTVQSPPWHKPCRFAHTEKKLQSACFWSGRRGTNPADVQCRMVALSFWMVWETRSWRLQGYLQVIGRKKNGQKTVEGRRSLRGRPRDVDIITGLHLHRNLPPTLWQ